MLAIGDNDQAEVRAEEFDHYTAACKTLVIQFF